MSGLEPGTAGIETVSMMEGITLRVIDLRSDTVTLPTPEMRQAMHQAELGDDVYGEDPTVRELEELGAGIMGKEAALFVASGTMGNQVAVMAHTDKGNEIICETESHIFYYEVAGLACLAGVQARQAAGKRGILSAEIIEQNIRAGDIHQPRTALICLENTHNRAGGTCYSLQDLKQIKELADRYNIPVHIDGARIFNAAAVHNVAVGQLAEHADSIMFCLSKGLCAPVGSLLAGSHDYIQNCRRYRKMLGGGMRQAGVIAAAGIVALQTMTERLQFDHLHAKRLAEALVNLGMAIDLETVQTNIVVASVAPLGMTAGHAAALLSKQGIRASVFGEYKLRFVTHYGIEQEDISYTAGVIAKTLNRL